MSTAEQIGAVGLLVSAASGIGGGLASVISPANCRTPPQPSTALGEEAGVLRVTFVISVVITAVCAILALIWAY